MSLRQLKAVYFVLAGINSFASAYFFNYLFFLLRDEFGFGSKENLMTGALHGFIYVGAAWYGGRFAQRHGYFTALRLGFGGMALLLALGSAFPTVTGQLLALAGWTVAICFTWPTLEALVSENENPAGLQKMVGIYNLVWAGTCALAFCLGGLLFETLGRRSLYWLPCALHILQLLLLAWLARRAKFFPHAPPAAPADTTPPSARAKLFLRLAWLANPFAYIAINTLLALIPTLARKFHLSTAESGAFGSIWFFVRLGTFLLLWQWTGWHYRFRWLLGAFLALIGSFATLLLAGQLWTLVFAQIIFGLAVGLIYYSSLFYSMDAGDTKGEHGGVHEAALGVGIFLGPAVGGAALHFAPAQPQAGAWAVSGLLVAGLAGMIWLRRRREAGS